MEIELGLDLVRTDVRHDRVAGVVAARTPRADVHLTRQHVGEFT